MVGVNIVSSIRGKVINKLLKFEKQFFDNHSAGELGSLLTNDTSLIANLITSSIPELITSVLSVMLVLVSLFILSSTLSITLLILLPLTLLIFIPLGNVLAKLSLQNQIYLGELNQFSNFITINSDFIKDNTTQNHEETRGKQLIQALRDIGAKQVKYMSIITPVLSFFLMLIILIVLTLGVYLISLEKLTVGSLVAYILLTLEILNPVTSTVSNLTALKVLKSAVSRIDTVLEDNQVEDIDTYSDLPTLHFNRLELRNVSFGYPDNEGVLTLKNINFSVNCGEIVAIVGPSGSGKSTLMDLITRKYKTDYGDILLNDKVIQDYGLQEVRANISYVSQHNTLLKGTVKDNLLYGITKFVPEDEILFVSKLTNFDSVINKLDNGLQFEINAGESNLSEGEIQRLSITHALLENTSLLLLDEVKSALDAENEQKIIDTLTQLSPQKCILLTAHRLSTVKKANKIIFLENGLVTGVGTHEELFTTHSQYRKYVLTQFD